MPGEFKLLFNYEETNDYLPEKATGTRLYGQSTEHRIKRQVPANGRVPDATQGRTM
jgi:hypothetical protein